MSEASRARSPEERRLLELAAQRLPDSAWMRASGWLMLAGIVLFSGSLYLLAVTGMREFGVVTPFGGVAFMLAWGLFAVAAIKNQ